MVPVTVTVPVMPIVIPVPVPIAVPVPFMALPAVVVILTVPVPFTALPVTGIITVFFVARGHPITASIRRTGPVTGVPVVARADRIPVSVHPRVARIGARRPLVDDHRRRRRWIVTGNTNANSYRKVLLREQRTPAE